MVHNYNTCQVWSTIVRPGVYLVCGTQLQYMSNMVNHSKTGSVSSLWYTTTIHVKYGQPGSVSSLWYTTTIHVKIQVKYVYLLCGTQLQYMSNMVNHSKTRECIFSVVHNYNTCQIWSTIVRPGVYLLCGTQLQYMSNMVNHSKTRGVSSLWYTTTIHVKYGQP